MSVLYPLALGLIPITLGLLLLAYRQSFRGVKQLVPSLFFLSQLQIPLKKRSLTWPPKRYLLDALLLSIVILGIAGILFETKTNDHAIVIDSSLSMGARDAQGVSYFEKALKLSRELNGDRYVNQDGLKKVGTFSTAEFKAGFIRGEVNLESLSQYTTITILSDGPRDFPFSSRVTVRTVRDPTRESDPNLALVSASRTSTGTNVSLNIKNFNSQPSSGKALIENTSGKTISESFFTLEPREQRTVDLTVPQDQNYLTAKITFDDGKIDTIEADNRTPVIEARSQSLQLVSPNIDAAQLASMFGGISGFSFDGDQRLPAIVFGGAAMPADAPRAVFVLPTESNAINANTKIVIKEKTENAAVFVAVGSHPLSRYVPPSGVVLPQAWSIGWDQGVPLWLIQNGAVLTEGTVDGRPVVALGWNPFPVSPSSPTVQKVIAYNVLHWLTEGERPLTPAEVYSMAPEQGGISRETLSLGYQKIKNRMRAVAFYDKNESDGLPDSVSIIEPPASSDTNAKVPPVGILAGILLVLLVIERFYHVREVSP